MARTRTLGNLRADVRQRADLVSSQFVTDAEVNENINQSIAELYDLIVSIRGSDYFEKVAPTITTTSNVGLYALPPDFYQLIRVEANLSGFIVPLLAFTQAEHGVLSQYPVQSGQSIIVKYVPLPLRLVSDADTFDGFGGWEEYVVVDAAMKCLEKEESDTGALALRLAKMTARIQNMAPNRDGWQPSRRQDMRRAPLSPYMMLPRPRYRILGTPDASGTVVPNIELVQGPLPGGIF